MISFIFSFITICHLDSAILRMRGFSARLPAIQFIKCIFWVNISESEMVIIIKGYKEHDLSSYPLSFYLTRDVNAYRVRSNF